MRRGRAVMRRWRLLDSGPGAGDWNMALDRALLEGVAGDQALEPATVGTAPVLRFYSWDAPTLSFGRMQRPPQNLLRRCAELGVTAVRRPTGGKAILHHHEVTFSIIAPAAGLGTVIESYRIFARAIAAALGRLGIRAAVCEPRQVPHRSGLLCFAAPASCDLEVGGRKLLGSAQARHGGALLQHNSLPLVLAHELKEQLFPGAAAEESKTATDLTAALDREPSFDEVRDAVIAGFESELGASFEPSALAPDELTAAEELRPVFAL